jgi:lysophospholipase L1-like esterase
MADGGWRMADGAAISRHLPSAIRLCHHPRLMTRRFERYVAIGDSTTEGLDDPDGHGGYRGWADRLAQRIASLQGSLLYANLAVRGRTTKQIRDEQLATAVAMKPDLSTVVSGTNDLLRRRFDAEGVASTVEEMQRALIGAGATVITWTLPDLRDVMPFARLMGVRTEALNDALRTACARSGALLLDLASHPVAGDPRLWSSDRLHANSAGHARVADALAYTLGLPDTDLSWSEPLPPAPPKTLKEKVAAEVAWGLEFLMPWMWRHLRGRSSGDGREAKRPRLTPV